jgi:hypothetical protein
MATIMIECGFVFNVSRFHPNDYSLSAHDEEGAPALRLTTVRDRLDSDGGYLIGCRRDDRLKQFAATLHSFEFDSNVTDGSDVQLEQHFMQSTSTDAGT